MFFVFLKPSMFLVSNSIYGYEKNIDVISSSITYTNDVDKMHNRILKIP